MLSTIKSQNKNNSTQKIESTISFPKNFPLPSILNQSIDSTVAKLEEKSRNEKCDNCNKNYRKYLCKMTNKISCSFECYLANKEKYQVA